MKLFSLFFPYNKLMNFLKNYSLIRRLTLLEISSRYKGSFLGVLWTFLTPLMMLTIYTFVFSEVFKAKWGVANENKVGFAITLFCGLNLFNILQEAIVSSSSIIRSNQNFVKKVIFPLEVLPVVSVNSSVFNCIVGYILLYILEFAFGYRPDWHVLYIFTIILPMYMFALGVGWFLSSISVYVRDVANFAGIIATVLLFTSPIFYPISAIPEKYHTFYNYNIVSVLVEMSRKAMIFNESPSLQELGMVYLISYLTMIAGLHWFMKTKSGFSDVL